MEEYFAHTQAPYCAREIIAFESRMYQREHVFMREISSKSAILLSVAQTEYYKDVLRQTLVMHKAPVYYFSSLLLIIIGGSDRLVQVVLEGFIEWGKGQGKPRRILGNKNIKEGGAIGIAKRLSENKLSWQNIVQNL